MPPMLWFRRSPNICPLLMVTHLCELELRRLFGGLQRPGVLLHRLLLLGRLGLPALVVRPGIGVSIQVQVDLHLQSRHVAFIIALSLAAVTSPPGKGRLDVSKGGDNQRAVGTERGVGVGGGGGQRIRYVRRTGSLIQQPQHG